MKKIISLLLVLALTLGCVFVIASCGGESANTPGTDTPGTDTPGTDTPGTDEPGTDTPGTDEPGADEPADTTADLLDEVANMYSNSNPTYVNTKSEQKSGGVELCATSTLVCGTVGGLEAAIYEVKSEELRTIEDGGGSNVIKESIVLEHTIYHYLEGKGTQRKDPTTGAGLGRWEADKTLIPERGGIAINLDKSVITTAEMVDGKLSFTVAAANTATVFGADNAIAADVAVVITTDGAVVTGISLSYTLAADDANGVPATEVNITVEYSYDIQQITM